MRRHGCRRWVGGTGRTSHPTEDFCHFSSLKSETSPTQTYFNFKYKVWLCMRYQHKIHFHKMIIKIDSMLLKPEYSVPTDAFSPAAQLAQ